MFRRLIVSNVMENHKLSDEHKKIAKEILNNGVHIHYLTESIFEGVILRGMRKAVV